MNKVIKQLSILGITSISTLVVLFPSITLAGHGDFQGGVHRSGDGFKAYVTNDDGDTVWRSDKTYKTKKRAQKKADKKAEELDKDGSVKADPECNDVLFHC